MAYSKTRWEWAQELVLSLEGGYVDHPADRGGATNMGVTQGTYSEWLLSQGRRIRSVRLITRQEVLSIYLTNYWNPSGAGACPLELSIVVFDMAVNSGPFVARKYLQKTLGVTADGNIGPATKQEIANQVAAGKQKHLARKMLDLRQQFYDSIVAKNPSQQVFANGWRNRLNHLRKWVDTVESPPA